LPANFAFGNQVFVFRKDYLFNTIMERLFCFDTQRMVLANMLEESFDGGKLRKRWPVLSNIKSSKQR